MKNKLKELRNKIENNADYRKAEQLWGGADVVFSDVPVVLDNTGWYGCDYLAVVTPHAWEASALMEDIRDIVMEEGWYSDLSKYVLFGETAQAALNYCREHDDLQGLLIAMIGAAIRVQTYATGKSYFAYGSNMDWEQMDYRCPESMFFRKAVLRDYRLALDSWGYATVIPCEGSVVEGCLWRISDEDEKSLDRYEGVRSGSYKRETIEVETDDGPESALIFISLRGEEGSFLREDYMQRIIASAEELKFTHGYIEMLRKLGR